MLRFAIFFLLLFHSLEGSPSQQQPDANFPNMWCISWHCSGSMYRCMTDINCREGLFCLQSCGTNSTCTFECVYRYKNEKYADFLACAVTKNGCVELKAEPTPYRCRNAPGKPLQDVNQVMGLIGTWQVIKGGHKFHDCRGACRELLITKTAELQLSITDKFVAILDQDIKRKVRNQKTVAVSKNGLHTVTYHLAGLKISEDWQVLEMSESTAKIFYCGHLGAWQYDGVLFLHREGASFEEINDAEAKCSINHSLLDFCADGLSRGEL